MATKVTITLSEEKLSAVKALFAYSGWDWNPDEEENVAENPEVSPSSGPAIEGNADRAECPDCLCRPCVMDESHRQHIYLFLIESPQIDITIKQHTKLVYALKSVAQRF